MEPQSPDPWPFSWPEADVARHQARRAVQPPIIDGRLDEPCWRDASRSPRFRDLVSGARAVHGTEAAVLWDDEYLYVGYWVEEPNVAATHTERDDPVYTDNDVELFIAGSDAYYEFEINAFGTIYEAFFVWDDAYQRDGYRERPDLGLDAPGYRPWNGVGYTDHPRGQRHGFFSWDLPGLRAAVHVDGTINDDSDTDRGWTVELALPWASLGILAAADGRACPPRAGDVWGMDFSRFNTYQHTAADSGGWAWSPHGVWDSHVPELFTRVEFVD